MTLYAFEHPECNLGLYLASKQDGESKCHVCGKKLNTGNVKVLEP